jgi:hypothetical protein
MEIHVFVLYTWHWFELEHCVFVNHFCQSNTLFPLFHVTLLRLVRLWEVLGYVGDI